MVYVFDSSTLINIFKHYYKSVFQTFWDNFNELIDRKSILSVREVRNELERRTDILTEWVKNNKSIFTEPTVEEQDFIHKIYQVRHFQNNINRKHILNGKPVADPFVIAKTKVSNGTVVTGEYYKENSANIPNICEHFNIRCMNLETFMQSLNWIF